MTLCDSSFLVALLGEGAVNTQHYRSVLGRIEAPLTLTWPCMTESMHLIHKRGGGWPRQKILLRLFASSFFDMFEIKRSDYERLSDLMEQYKDRPMDFADASLVLAAEKTGERRILTLDSDFLFYRINKKESFEILTL